MDLARDPAPACILFVDDEAAVRAYVKLALERENYRVLTAHNSVEALVVAADFPGDIDILLTDVEMRVAQNGIELASCFNILRPESRIVLTSGYALPARISRENRWDFLAKPFSQDQLMAMVAKNLRTPAPTALP